jgi:hypothetical protein
MFRIVKIILEGHNVSRAWDQLERPPPWVVRCRSTKLALASQWSRDPSLALHKATNPQSVGAADSKQAQVIAMLKRPRGVTVDEIMAATGWQAHTVRGFFAGALKKRLGVVVASEKVEGRGRVYRLPG